MATTQVYRNGHLIGCVLNLKFDQPFYYGRWEPADAELDRLLREEVAKYDDPGAWTAIVTLDDEPQQYYITSLEGDSIDMRFAHDEKPMRRWWQFWKS